MERMCPVCGIILDTHEYVCTPCAMARREQLRECRRPVASAMGKAIRQGLIPQLPDGRPCVDCGHLARVWDHRDYAKPLEVDAVCLRCDRARGPAKGSGALLPHPREGLYSAGKFFKSRISRAAKLLLEEAQHQADYGKP